MEVDTSTLDLVVEFLAVVVAEVVSDNYVDGKDLLIVVAMVS